MSEVKKIATRESYGNALAELGKEFDNLVVLDADLSGATKTGIFKKAFPERHINCGIAEGNMMTVAAGIATTGKVPFASTFAVFAAIFMHSFQVISSYQIYYIHLCAQKQYIFRICKNQFKKYNKTLIFCLRLNIINAQMKNLCNV